MISVSSAEVVFNPGTALENRALHGVDLEVRPGEFVTVIGSNGAGKSTLLGVVSGDVPLRTGRVSVDGEDMTKVPAHRRAGQVARVFQDPLAGTCAELTVEENMALALGRGNSRGWGLAVTDPRREVFRERLRGLGLGLENRLSDRVGLLSGGQRQAVSLMMATLAPSRILLLDEHTAALDPRMAGFVLDLTRRVCEEFNLATLMVTHSMKDALSCGSRTLMLHQGGIVLNVSGAERKRMTAADLLRLFSEARRGEEVVDDKLLLS